MLIILVIYTLTLYFDWDRKVVKALYISTITQLITSMGMLAIGVFRAFGKDGV